MVGKLEQCVLDASLYPVSKFIRYLVKVFKEHSVDHLSTLVFWAHLSIGSPYTEGKHRIRTLSILTMKKRNYLYMREVSEIGKGGRYVTKTGVVVQPE